MEKLKPVSNLISMKKGIHMIDYAIQIYTEKQEPVSEKRHTWTHFSQLET